jgi:hypothetical protein
MPYITCPDGKTYSRYDQSEYVKWCICNEKHVQEQKFNECMQDPKCKSDYDSNINIFYSITFIFIILITLVLVKINFKST